MTSMERLKILVVDDEARIREEIEEFLTDIGHRVHQAGGPTDAFRSLATWGPDILILDIKLPETDGLTVLETVKSRYPEIEVIMITGHGDMESAIRAMRLGAVDYLQKPLRLNDIRGAVERTGKFLRLNRRLQSVEKSYSLLSKEFQEAEGHRMIGQGKAMQRVLDLMTRVAASGDTSVLITGESGTGKELAARGIHHLSERRDGYFYPVNVSAIPESLFESELFGHVKGAFTGATANRAGCFEYAEGGALFMDEICDLAMPLQARLLRVLEERRVRRIGAHRETRVDVRLISATNRDIESLVTEDAFRADLYHRLNTFRIHLPALRDRPGDIPPLIEHFVDVYSKKLKKQISSIEPGVFDQMAAYSFPGNVRELKNILERAVILCDGGRLLPRHVSGATPNIRSTDSPGQAERLDLEATEKRLIQRALAETGHNKSQAAKLLNISWQALNRRMKKHRL